METEPDSRASEFICPDLMQVFAFGIPIFPNYNSQKIYKPFKSNFNMKSERTTKNQETELPNGETIGIVLDEDYQDWRNLICKIKGNGNSSSNLTEDELLRLKDYSTKIQEAYPKRKLGFPSEKYQEEQMISISEIPFERFSTLYKTITLIDSL
jgi:hypothetical protein